MSVYSKDPNGGDRGSYHPSFGGFLMTSYPGKESGKNWGAAKGSNGGDRYSSLVNC